MNAQTFPTGNFGICARQLSTNLWYFYKSFATMSGATASEDPLQS